MSFFPSSISILSTNYGGKRTVMQGVGQNYYERPKSKFWTFLIKSSMIVLKSAFPKPFWSPNSIFKLYIFYTNIQRFVVCVF